VTIRKNGSVGFCDSDFRNCPSRKQDTRYIRTCFRVLHDERNAFGSPIPQLFERDVAPIRGVIETTSSIPLYKEWLGLRSWHLHLRGRAPFNHGQAANGNQADRVRTRNWPGQASLASLIGAAKRVDWSEALRSVSTSGRAGLRSRIVLPSWTSAMLSWMLASAETQAWPISARSEASGTVPPVRRYR
jgi:hypothetical protein